jgi:LuxR family quorum sensing-dependent transcriptional regulator
MNSRFHRNLTLDTIDIISRHTLPSQVGETLVRAVGRLGFNSFGINGLPPLSDGADLVILIEDAPKGFRDHYVEERFYQMDHICAHARTAYEPFRFSEARYNRADAASHRRFMEALDLYGMGKGIIVPIGHPARIPACVWAAGKDPDLHDDAMRTVQLVSLFAASKAHALVCSKREPPNRLTEREREVLQWISAGKTSWEIGAIFGLSERAISKIIGDVMAKLNAVTRTQAVVNAIRDGEIEL